MFPSSINQSNLPLFENRIENIRPGNRTPFSRNHSHQADALEAAQLNQHVNQCSVCYRKFTKTYIFQRHVARRDCSAFVSCEYCDRGFKSRATLHQHLKVVHSNGSRPLKCPDCAKTFSRASSLSQHRKTHSPYKDFVCVVCGAAFHQKGNLKTHLAIHFNKKSFFCPYCNRTFSRMSYMTQHRQVMHEPEAKPAELRCEICSGLFFRPYLLKSHELKTHGIVREESPKALPPPAALPAPCNTAIVVPAIQTSAMAVVKSRGEIPFAVLHMINEIPLIVRVVEQGQYSILKAAECEDFRESQRGGPGLEDAKSVSIAVVATIYQKVSAQGKFYFEVSGPVPCYQTNKSPLDGRPVALRESIANTNLHKTLTQLNATEVCTNINMLQKDLLLPAARSYEVDDQVTSTSGSNKLKRKQTTLAAAVSMKRAPLRPPRVTTVMGNNPIQPTMSQICERNFQNIATGPLLSPERSTLKQHVSNDVMEIEQEDPFSGINVFDLIQTGNELLTNDGHMQDIEIEETIFFPLM